MSKIKIKRIKPTIAYSSSLLQQNHSESLTGHGLIEWDLSDLSYKEVDIANEYGYYTLEVEESQIKNWIEEIPLKPRFRVRFKNTPLDERKKIEAFVRSKRQVQEWTVQLMDKSYGEVPQTIAISNIRDIEYQNQLLEDFYPANPLLPKIKEINKEVNTRIEDSYAARNTQWKPLLLQFSNMFSYGENNTVDFTNMSGTYGLFAPNASGKSSLQNILCFCLFDKCSVSSQAKEVLNRAKDKFTCKLEFLTNNKRYVIEKEGTKDNKGHVKVDINFYTFNDAGEKVSLNGDQRATTNKNIRNYVGVYEDFILTALSTQSGGQNFVDKSQKERRDLLVQFIDIEIFEDFYKLAYEDFKEAKILVEDLQKQDFSEKLAQAHLNKEQYVRNLEGWQEMLTEKEAFQDKVILVKESLLTSLENIEQLPKEEMVQNDLQSLSRTLKSQEDTYTALKENTLLETELKTTEDQYNNLNITQEECEEKVAVLDSLEGKVRDLDKNIALVNSALRRCEDDILILQGHQFDSQCEFCVKHPVVAKGKKSQEESTVLKSQLQSLKEEEAVVKSEKIILEPYREKLNLVRKIKSRLLELSTKIAQKGQLITQQSSLISQITAQIQEKNTLLEKIRNVVDIQRKNEETQGKIKQCNDALQNTKNEINYLNRELSDCAGKIKLQDFIIEEAVAKIEQLKELGDRYEAYKLYLQAVKSSGIPYRLIERILPEIQTKVNEILNQIVDFEILLEADGQTSINAFITYGHERFWTLEGGSGMERFISSLAIRTALITSTSLPKPNFICIDEGFGVLDSENLSNITILLELLKGQFEFILCISHLDAMKDIVDQQIEISKDGGYSKINHV